MAPPPGVPALLLEPLRLAGRKVATGRTRSACGEQGGGREEECGQGPWSHACPGSLPAICSSSSGVYCGELAADADGQEPRGLLGCAPARRPG